MLKPIKMKRVAIAGTKNVMDSTISTLHRQNVLHITDYKEEGEDFRIGLPLKRASKLSEHLLSLRTIANQLGVTEKESALKRCSKEIPSQIDEKITNLQKEVSYRGDELRRIEFQIMEKEDIISEVRPFFGLPLSLDAYHGYKTIKVYTGFI